MYKTLVYYQSITLCRARSTCQCPSAMRTRSGCQYALASDEESDKRRRSRRRKRRLDKNQNSSLDTTADLSETSTDLSSADDTPLAPNRPSPPPSIPSHSVLHSLTNKQLPLGRVDAGSPILLHEDISPKSYLQLIRDKLFSERYKETLQFQSQLYDKLELQDTQSPVISSTGDHIADGAGSIDSNSGDSDGFIQLGYKSVAMTETRGQAAVEGSRMGRSSRKGSHESSSSSTSAGGRTTRSLRSATQRTTRNSKQQQQQQQEASSTAGPAHTNTENASYVSNSSQHSSVSSSGLREPDSVRRRLDFSPDGPEPTSPVSRPDAPGYGTPDGPLSTWVTTDRGGFGYKESYSPESGYGGGVSASGGSADSDRFVPGDKFFSEWDASERGQEGWDTPRKIQASTRRLSLHQPTNHYIAYSSDQELNDWWQGDRTDYTYSASLSYRSNSPHRRVGSPNMARRALRGAAPGNTSLEDSFGSSTVQATGLQQYYEERSASRLNSRTLTDSEDEGDALSSRLRGSLDTTDLLQRRSGAGPASNTIAGANTRYSSSTTTVTSVRYGLDYESDGDDFTAGGSGRKRLQHRATPRVATNNNNTIGGGSTLLGNHLPSTSFLLGNNITSSNNSASQDYSSVNRYSSGRYLYATDDGDVGSDGREGGVFSSVASAAKSTVSRLANTPTVIRNALSSIVLLGSSKNGDTVSGSGDYDASSNTYHYNSNGRPSSANNNNIEAKYTSILGESVSRSRSSGSASSVQKSPMVLRSRRRVGRSQDFEQEDQTQEEYDEEEYTATPGRGLSRSSSQTASTKTSDYLPLSYLMTLVTVSTLCLVNGVASAVTSSATKLSNGSRMILPLTSSAFRALTDTFSGSGKLEEDPLANHKDQAYSTYTSTTTTETRGFNSEEPSSKLTGSNTQDFGETTGWLSWFGSLVAGVFTGKRGRRRGGKRVSFKEHSMSTRGKARRHGSSDVDDGLLSPDDVSEHDYNDYDTRESDFDETDEDAEDGKASRRSSSTVTTITTSITTVVTSFVDQFSDVCFKVEELGRWLVGAPSRREEREILKRLRLEGKTGYLSGTQALGGEGDRDGTDSLLGVRKKQGDISYEVSRDSVRRADDGGAAGWCWWLLPLVLLLAVFFVMTGWAFLLGADDLTTAVTATAANITSSASSALTTLATAASTTSSATVSYLATATVTTFDAITSAAVFTLGWIGDGLSWLWSIIVGVTWSFAGWCYNTLCSMLSVISNGLSASYLFILSLFWSSEGDVGSDNNTVKAVAKEGVVQSALHAISSSVYSVYLGVVSSAQSAGSGTVALVTAGTDATSSGLSALWSGLFWIPSSVVAGATAVTDVLYSFVLWLWEGLFWGVSGLWEGLGAVLWWFWGLMVGLTSLIGSGVVSMAGNTANRTIETANYVKLTMAPIFEGGSTGDSSTAPSVSVPPSGGGLDPPLPPSVPAIEELVAQLLQSEQLHQRLGAAVSSEVATQTTAAAATQAAQHRQTALLLKQLQQHHQHLKLQLRQLAASLVRVESAGNSGQAELSLSLEEERQQRLRQHERLDSVHGALNDISKQIEEMQRNHSLLSAEVKSCCQRSLLTLTDVDAHVTGLIASLIGYQAAGDVTGSAPSTGDLKAWMSTYFVAKEEMEQQIGQLTQTMEKQIQDYRDAAMSAGATHEGTSAATSPSLDAKTLEQTQQLIMAHVTEQLHETLRVQITRDLQKDMQTQLDAKIPEGIKETLLPEGEFAGILQSKLKREVDAKFKSSDVESQLRLNMGAQLKAHLEDGGEFKKDLVAYFEPQLHSHVALTVKNQVEDQVQARVEQELEAKLEDKLVQTRMDFKADLDVIDQKVNAEVGESNNQKVVAALTASLPRLLPPTATQPAALNDTVRAIVAEAVAAHMGTRGSQSCDKKGPLPLFTTSADSEDTSNGDSIIAAALLQSASTLAGVAVASTSEGDLNLIAGGSGGDVNITMATDGTSSLLTRAEVQRMVAAALKKYDADRTGLADHALETAGGAIVSTRCTESYEVNQAQLIFLGVPWYRYSTNTPRSIIQPDRQPGQCWAFKGSQGYVVIRLAAPVRPTSFTLEHIPRDLSPFGNIDSAPKNFTVWGLNTENDEGYELGKYLYREDGEALQYFTVANPSGDYYPFIELKIDSNHGNMKYTCIYRFRVHGVRLTL